MTSTTGGEREDDATFVERDVSKSDYAWVDERSDDDFINEMYNQASTKAEYRIVELARQALASRASIPEAGAEVSDAIALLCDLADELCASYSGPTVAPDLRSCMEIMRDVGPASKTARAALAAAPLHDYRAGMLRAAEIVDQKRENYLSGLNTDYRDRSTWQHGSEEAYRLSAKAIRAEALRTSAPEPRDEGWRDIEHLTKALEWYGEQARLCRLIHSEGDAGRHALSEDGGKRAREALAPTPEGLEEQADTADLEWRVEDMHLFSIPPHFRIYTGERCIAWFFSEADARSVVEAHNAQGERVRWEWKHPESDVWFIAENEKAARARAAAWNTEARALYTAPPVSEAIALVEALEPFAVEAAQWGPAPENWQISIDGAHAMFTVGDLCTAARILAEHRKSEAP